MPHPMVDPRFAARLRELRRQRGLSLRDLSRSAYLSKSTLSELENGRGSPTPDTARALDQALAAGGEAAGGELAGMVAEVTGDPESLDRIGYAVTYPARLDAAAVDAFAESLAAERRLDDVVDAVVLLPIAVAQWRTISGLARDARGLHAPALHRVAAEQTQFLGWLAAGAGRDAEAVRLLAESVAQAEAVGDRELVAQGQDFRGWLDRQRGRDRAAARHHLAAYHTPGAHPLQQAVNAVHAAHGLARIGADGDARRLLAEAGDLVDGAEDRPVPRVAYWLSPTFLRLGVGLAWLALDNRAEAATQLRTGLSGLPADQQGAEWTGEYRAALTEAEAGA